MGKYPTFSEVKKEQSKDNDDGNMAPKRSKESSHNKWMIRQSHKIRGLRRGAMRVGMEMTEEEKNTIEVEQTQFEKEKSHK